MIPVIIITENGESFPYFTRELTPKDLYDKGLNDGSLLYVIQYRNTKTNSNCFESKNPELRNKVLDKIHRAVPEYIFTITHHTKEQFGSEYKVQTQVCVKIFMEDIIRDAKKELKID